MPVVPIEENKVGIASLTDAKLRPADLSGTGLDAIGGGLRAVGNAGMDLGKAIGGKPTAPLTGKDAAAGKVDQAKAKPKPGGKADPLQEAKPPISLTPTQAANDAAVKGGYCDYVAATRHVIHPDNDAPADQQGVAPAVAARKRCEQLLDAYKGVAASLSPEQHEALHGVMTQRLAQDQNLIRTQEASAALDAQRQQSQRVVDTSADDAVLHYGTPAFAHSMATGLRQIEEQAALGVLPPEARQAAEANFISRVHRKISESYAGGDVILGAEHLRLFGSHMTPEDRAEAWKALHDPLVQIQAVADADMPGIADAATAPLTPQGDSTMLAQRMLAITPAVRAGGDESGAGAGDTTDLPALVEHYGGDAAKAWAASAIGADALDASVAKQGARWFGALPKEARNQVAALMAMLGAATSPRRAPTPAERAKLAGDIEDQPWSDERKQNVYAELNTRIGLDARRAKKAQDDAWEEGVGMAGQLSARFISVNQLPPAVRTGLSPEALAALTLRADRNVHSVTVPAHGDVAMELNRMAVSDPQRFVQEDLRLHRDRMAPGEYASLKRTQEGLKGYPPSGQAVTQQRGWEALERQFSVSQIPDGTPISQNAIFRPGQGGGTVPSLIQVSRNSGISPKTAARLGTNPVTGPNNPEGHGQPGQPKPVAPPPEFSIGFGKGRKAPIAPGPGRTFFFGGAGNEDASYKADFVQRLIESGIKSAVAVPQSATSKSPPNGFKLDALSIPSSNNTFPDGVYLQTPGVAPGRSGQYNLIGYSFGAVAAAQQAFADAKMGKVVDNLVLIGAPINDDLKAALQANGNIRRVLYIDIKGDPIRAGNSDFNYLRNLPTVYHQMGSGEGHFYFTKLGSQGAARRSNLAKQLYALGMR